MICDITRPVPNQLILSQVLPTLEAAGIPRDKVTILVATGLHRPATRPKIVEMVGARKSPRTTRVENHHGTVLAEHTYLGESPRGVPVWIDSRVCEGRSENHDRPDRAAFDGRLLGRRKLICPGLAALETVKVWHGPAFLEHPNADCGILDGNPVHEENTWIGRQAGCDFIINAVIDAERRPLALVAGDMEAAFLEGVAFVRGVVVDTVPAPVDVVVQRRRLSARYDVLPGREGADRRCRSSSKGGRSFWRPA